MTIHNHIVTSEEQGTRIDKLLTDMEIATSRSQVQSWIKDGFIRVNELNVKPNYKCLTDDTITWAIPETKPLELQAENIPLDIVYEDEDLIVINKARGMVVHPSAGHETGTLVHALLYHAKGLSGINGIERPGIVHRIDKDTSGLLVVAKNDLAHLALTEQIKAHEIERIYEALVHGEINHDTGLIDAPIARNPQDRQKMAIVADGKRAVTHFQVIKRFPKYTHVECRLETGRTHQIRVHMKYIGHPIVGDPKYGLRKTLQIGGQALHAKKLSFKHPRTNEQLTFTAEAPPYFNELLTNFDQMY